MKFTCDQSNLTKALNIVSRAVTSRTTIPILKGILLRAEEGGGLYLSASDLDISIETRIEALVSEEGSLVMPSKLFGDVVRKMPRGEVIFDEVEKGIAKIKCHKSEFRVMGMPADEFPKSQNEFDGEEIKLEKSKMKEMIRRTCFAASVDETRGIITGVLIEMKKGSLNMVALDGFRMAVAREKTDVEEEKNIIIPAGIMNEAGRIMTDAADEGERPEENEEEKDEKKTKEKEKFSILTNDKRIMFDLGKTVVISRLLEGVFVKYEDIIPREYKTSVIIDREEMKESVERASVLIKEGKNNFIKMEFSDGRLILTSRNEEGAFRDEIATEQKGEGLEIGFNAKFILDALKAIPDEEIKMELNTSVTPCLIRPKEGDSYEYLILPVRLAGS
jgi:DNA polymerase-3 subunit beta